MSAQCARCAALSIENICGSVADRTNGARQRISRGPRHLADPTPPVSVTEDLPAILFSELPHGCMLSSNYWMLDVASPVGDATEPVHQASGLAEGSLRGSLCI